MKNYLFRGHYAQLINQSFQIILVSYLFLLLIDQIWVGIVSNYLNLNYLLIFVIILGVLDVFSDNKIPSKKMISWRDYLFIALLGLAGFLIIKIKTSSLDWLSWVISIIAGILIILLSILVLEDDEID